MNVAAEGMEFIGHLISAASASSSAKLAQTDLGAQYPLGKQNSDTHWGLVKNGASSFAVASHVYGTVTRLIDALSTVNGRVAFVIDEAWRQLDS